ncbi:MAG: tRNA 2-thiocytidine(32) synthetase TtcA [Ruminococcaceae bacterium]|nr:tRNA 2-thiocytidine(32) synthetase TtcA [Oscillospiraceae bacterium]
MIFYNIRRLLSYTRRAVDDYSLIEENDKIAVGISGGKDSMALLCALIDMRRFYPKKYDICAITVDMGFEGSDFSSVAEFCQKNDVEYILIKTELADIIFNKRKESNPCSLCSKMRRGILNEEAKKAGCNKLALGHHFDDVVDTFMLNLIHEGRLGSFSPYTYLDRSDMALIRPFIYVHEKDIKYFMRRNEVPVVESLCPEDKKTEREEAGILADELEKRYKGFKHRVFGALQKADIDGYGKKKKEEDTI